MLFLKSNMKYQTKTSQKCGWGRFQSECTMWLTHTHLKKVDLVLIDTSITWKKNRNERQFKRKKCSYICPLAVINKEITRNIHYCYQS